jgi:fumarate reductase subunit C
MSLYLYIAQRLSALVLAPLVVGHIILMILAVRHGLTAEEILGRTQGSFVWAGYYALFVLALAVHAAIGVRNIARETFPWSGRTLDLFMIAIGSGLLLMGARAVYAVVA